MYQIPTNLFPTTRLLLPLALALCTVAFPAAGAEESAETTVEQFLSRLGLTDVQILHVEQQFERAADASRRQLGKKLADLYAQRLMEAADDKQAYADIVARVTKLIKEIPEANTPALQVMILQADYNRAEKLILEWINDHGQPLEDAKQILVRIAPQLDRHWRDLASEAERLNEQINKLDDEDAQERMEEELRRLQAVLGRASFFAGWSNFYLGVTKQDRAAAKGPCTKGRAAFRQLLGLQDDDKYEDVEGDWLGLESIWRSRAVIGLGLCETALDNIASAKICFKLLEHINTPPAIRDQGAYWFVSGLLQTGHLTEAIEFSGEQVEKFSGGATQGKVSFCVALIRAQYADLTHANQQTRQLAALGIDGLARLRQLGVLRQLMSKYKIELNADAGFYLQWVNGQQLFEKAESSKEKADYLAAAKVLEDALKQPEARKDLAAAGQCRFILAWCRYRLGDFEQGAKQFVDAMPALKESGDKQKAIQAAWMAFATYHRLARSEKRFVEPAISAAKTLTGEFPESQEAKKVGYYLAKLQKAAGKPRDRIKALRAVKSDDVNFENAQYEICLLWHQVWSADRDDPSKATAAAKELVAAADRFISIAKHSSANLRKLKCGLLAVDVLLRAQPAGLSSAIAYLKNVEPFTKSLPAGNSSVAEYHYRQFQVARLQNNITAQQKEAQWLLENAKGTLYERSAIITLARMADDALKNAPPAERPRRLERALEVYGRLVEIVGNTPEAIAASKNAQVANSKLAKYEVDAGQLPAAVKRLDKLLAVHPKNRDYLRRAGLATFHGKMYAASLEHWRVLLAGLSKGSSPWYEAKYHQLACLQDSDRAAAKKVYRQFKLLYPVVKDANWRAKFEQFDRSLAN